MAFDSYRDFVNRLDQAGELKRITQPVATELEITELADREMKSPGGGKALLIEQPTVNGVVSPFPVAINSLGSHKRMAMSLGASSVDEAAAELGALMKAKPPTSLRETLKLLGQAMDLRHAKPKLVKDGPCKEVIHLVESSKLKVESWPAAPRVTEPATFNLQPATLQLGSGFPTLIRCFRQ
ncbi:MAG: UbiD family decarboxylase [Verrucomicrobia bacterium]|nr:UbiD family decarboxylase [Verrucomicrobiota bacterium]